MSSKSPGEQRLLADVVQDAAYATTREAVKARCVEESRARRRAEVSLATELVGQGATTNARRPPTPVAVGRLEERPASAGAGADEAYPAVLETVRAQCVSALRRRRILSVWSRVAAAAAVAILVGASFLLRTPDQPPPLIAEDPPAPVVPGRPSYLVASRPVPPGIIVRSSDQTTEIEFIGDDELLEAVPGLAIARVSLPEGGRKVIVSAPSLDRVVRVN